MCRCIRKHIRLFLDIPKKNVLHGQPESSIFNKKLRKNKNPAATTSWIELFFCLSLVFPWPTPEYLCPKWLPHLYLDEREHEKQYSIWEDFLFFFTQALTFENEGKGYISMGCGLGCPPDGHCVGKSYSVGLPASRRFSEEDFLLPEGFQKRRF